MDAEKLHQELYDKMAAEQERFKHGLLGLTPEGALNHAYEFTIREDILMAMEFIELPTSQMAALLESPAPLADIFKDFRDMETGRGSALRAVLKVCWRPSGRLPVLFHSTSSPANTQGNTES